MVNKDLRSNDLTWRTILSARPLVHGATIRPAADSIDRLESALASSHSSTPVSRNPSPHFAFLQPATHASVLEPFAAAHGEIERFCLAAGIAHYDLLAPFLDRRGPAFLARCAPTPADGPSAGWAASST